MPNISINVRVRKDQITPNLKAQLKRLKDPSPHFRNVGKTVLIPAVKREFRTNGMGEWEGPASITLIKRKASGFGGKKPLKVFGALKQEAIGGLRIGRDSVRLVSTSPRAKFLHNGGTIRVPELSGKTFAIFKSTREKAWKNYGTVKRVGGGFLIFRRRIKAHTITVPGRPFYKVRKQDINKIKQKALSFFKGILKIDISSSG